MDWKTLLAYISGSVDEALLLRNEYLAAENRILHDQIKGRVQLTDADRQTLAEIGKKLGKQALEAIATIVKPDTIEVCTWCGLVTYYVLFFLHVGTRRVHIAGVTPHPDATWMKQVACHETIVDAAGVKRVKLPARSTKFACFCRALGEISEIRGVLEADFIWRTVPLARLDAIYMAFSRRVPSPGHRQRHPIPCESTGQ